MPSHREILDSLARGFDPFTGELLESDGPLSHPSTVRALFVAATAVGRAEAAERRQKSLPEQAGVAWTAEEEAQLVASFDGGARVPDLARQHGRTRTAIEARLARLGKAPQPYFARRADE